MLFENNEAPGVSLDDVVEVSNYVAAMTCPTVAASLKHLTRLWIVRELTSKERHRLFVYDEYLKILNEGTEPLR